MSEKMGDNVTRFPKKNGIERHENLDEKGVMIEKLGKIIAGFEHVEDAGVRDTVYVFEDFQKKLEKPNYKISENDRNKFQTSIVLAEDLLRKHLPPQEANDILGASNVA